VADDDSGGESGRTDRLTDRIGLGVLTRLVHRDLIDEVLLETGKIEPEFVKLNETVVIS